MSVTAAVFPAPAVSFSESSFSAVSNVRMAPVKANRRLAVVVMATPNKDVKEKVNVCFLLVVVEPLLFTICYHLILRALYILRSLFQFL